MSMNEAENILVGYSGHARVVADAAMQSGIRISYYTEIREVEYNPLALKYFGNESENDFRGWGNHYGFILGIGDNMKRFELARFILSKGENLLTVIHPRSVVSEFASIGQGTFIAAQSTVNAFAEVGRFAILNTNSVVEHDCKVEEGAHIASGAVLAGNVRVGKRTFVGANAVIKEGITIGQEVTVGAGSVIIDDIPDGKTVVGNPGTEI